MGLRKPHPKIFELALDVLQRDAEEVAFIDDRSGNVDAADGVGNSRNPLSGLGAMKAEFAEVGDAGGCGGIKIMSLIRRVAFGGYQMTKD